MSQYFAKYTDVSISLFGFGLFATVFIGWVIWTGQEKQKKNYDVIAKNILSDGEQQ